MAEGEERYVELAPRGRSLPLNSKRLTVAHVQQLARTLALPTTASSDDIRQMTDGKLTEMGREPPIVQVIVQREVEGGRAYLYLQDASGVFLESEPDPEPSAHRTEKEVETGEEEADEVETLKQALDKAIKQNAALDREVSSLRKGLQKQKDRVKELWKLNCEQLADHDSIIPAKDVEISSLRARVEELTMHEHAPGRESSATTGVRLIDPDHTSPHRGPRDRMSPDPRLPGPRPPIACRGKAPTIDFFTGENQEICIDDWLPALERASTWNGWTEEEWLMQLAGHLSG